MCFATARDNSRGNLRPRRTMQHSARGLTVPGCLPRVPSRASSRWREHGEAAERKAEQEASAAPVGQASCMLLHRTHAIRGQVPDPLQSPSRRPLPASMGVVGVPPRGDGRLLTCRRRRMCGRGGVGVVVMSRSISPKSRLLRLLGPAGDASPDADVCPRRLPASHSPRPPVAAMATSTGVMSGQTVSIRDDCSFYTSSSVVSSARRNVQASAEGLVQLSRRQARSAVACCEGILEGVWDRQARRACPPLIRPALMPASA